MTQRRKTIKTTTAEKTEKTQLKEFATKANVPESAVSQVTYGSIPWLSRIWFFLQLRSGFWSVPLAFFMYYFVGVFLAWAFGWGTGFYDPSFIQPLFLAGAVVLGICSFVQFIFYFDFRTIHRYIWGKHKSADGIIINFSKSDFKTLTEWQRLLLVTFLLCFFVLIITLVYLKMVAPTQTQLPQ